MDKLKKIICSPFTTIIAFGMAAIFIGFSTIGGARAALTYYSETYASQVEMHDIGVSLMENNVNVSTRDYFYEVADGTWSEHTGVLLGKMLAKDEKLVLGKPYKEELAVLNSGTIDTYVRVTIYKYWVDADGNKSRVIDPAMIELSLTNIAGMSSGNQCWIEDTTAATAERTVLYYNRLLKSGEVSPIFSDTIKINDRIASNVSTSVKEDGTIISTYDYNGYQFVLEADVDSVQDHNAQDAILSAWGKEVTINDNQLALK